MSKRSILGLGVLGSILLLSGASFSPAAPQPLDALASCSSGPPLAELANSSFAPLTPVTINLTPALTATPTTAPTPIVTPADAATPPATFAPATSPAAALPKCTGVYKDITTAHTAYSDWQTTLVDTIYRLPASYYPPDLTSTGLPGGGLIRALAKPDLTALAKAAAAAGAPLQVTSAFRSYNTQVSTFNYWVRVAGKSAALLSSARPGHSEHQLGLAIDFTSRGGALPWTYADWATTKAGRWMANNAWRYGWVLSYPKGKSPSVTCYIYEPWHYRYVGRSEAAAIHASGLTTRAYLWTLQ
jgi:D-alanyl-D-alanine carboxypeptidase